MNYKDVIKNSKFYVPMNLNLGYLLENDTDIIVLMNVINCDTINEKLSVRKLMRYTNRANNTIQQSLRRLRTLKLIEGFKPQYETLKHIFDAINNAHTIEERKNWCKVYQDSIQKNVSESGTNVVYQELVQKTVSESGTESVSESGTQIKKMDKEDIYKKDIYNNEYIENDNILEENDNTLEINNDLIEKEFEKPIEKETIIDFDWETELEVLHRKIKNSSTCEELKMLSTKFNEMQEKVEIPIELKPIVDELKRTASSKVWLFKAKQCYS